MTPLRPAREVPHERLAAVLEAATERFGWRPGWQPAGRPAWQDGQWVWRGAGLAVGLEKGGRVATCPEVLADGAGQVRVRRIVTAYECGAVVNPDTMVSQIEGGCGRGGPADSEVVGQGPRSCQLMTRSPANGCRSGRMLAL